MSLAKKAQPFGSKDLVAGVAASYGSVGRRTFGDCGSRDIGNNQRQTAESGSFCDAMRYRFKLNRIRSPSEVASYQSAGKAKQFWNAKARCPELNDNTLG